MARKQWPDSKKKQTCYSKKKRKSKPRKQFSLTATIYDKRGYVLSIGQNSYVKTHPLMKEYGDKVGEPKKLTIHAELAAILKCRNLTKADKIVITRFNEQGEPVSAKPCKICQMAIQKVGIFHIEHT